MSTASDFWASACRADPVPSSAQVRILDTAAGHAGSYSHTVCITGSTSLVDTEPCASLRLEAQHDVRGEANSQRMCVGLGPQHTRGCSRSGGVANFCEEAACPVVTRAGDLQSKSLPVSIVHLTRHTAWAALSGQHV